MQCGYIATARNRGSYSFRSTCNFSRKHESLSRPKYICSPFSRCFHRKILIKGYMFIKLFSKIVEVVLLPVSIPLLCMIYIPCYVPNRCDSESVGINPYSRFISYSTNYFIYSRICGRKIINLNRRVVS